MFPTQKNNIPQLVGSKNICYPRSAPGPSHQVIRPLTITFTFRWHRGLGMAENQGDKLHLFLSGNKCHNRSEEKNALQEVNKKLTKGEHPTDA